MRSTKSKRNRTASGSSAKPESSISPTKNSHSTSEIINPKSDIVLLAVTGMSPAVLTETVWALAHEPEPVIPNRVLVLTSAIGRQSLIDLLFAPSPRFHDQPPWVALREALAREGHDLRGKLRFGTTSSDIRVITTAEAASGQSRELADLRTPADNEAAADFFLEEVRTIVENPDTHLIASIAGGRKTMGALLYACLTLVGRETDRLTHVLVNEPFETQRDFFFPGQPGGSLLTPYHRAPPSDFGVPPSTASLDPSTARVELADVPFVPLRNLFTRELGRKAGTFANLVNSCREIVRERAGAQVRLQVSTTRTELDVNGTRVKLAPLEHLLLLFLARRARNEEPAFASYKDAVDCLNGFRRETIQGAKPFDDWRHSDSLRKDWDEQEIRKATSGLRGKLRRAGGNAPLLAVCLPEKGRCSLSVPGELIFVKELAS